MKTLKLNMLEKSEMNAVRGGDFVCAQYCLKQCEAYAYTINEKASPTKTNNQQSRSNCYYAIKKAH